jgi:hypothetical protein
MANILGRNVFRAIILILTAGLVIGILYALSLMSVGTALDPSDFLGQGQGDGQFQTSPQGAEFQPAQEGEFGQRNGFGSGRFGDGQGFGRGFGEGRGGENEFSLTRGLAEFVKNLIVITVLIVGVSLLQNLAKRRRRVSLAS